MSKVFAILTSDPNLIRCELCRLKDEVRLVGEPRSNAVGIGWYAQEEVLLRRHKEDLELGELCTHAGMESEALLYHGQQLALGLSLEENTQPFRYRRWLFAHAGVLHSSPSMRTRLLSSLPEFLRRQIRGETDSEVAFALFLKALRDTGRTEARHLEPAIAAQLLGKVARSIEALAAEVGVRGKSSLSLLATNGRMLVAARSGSEPLHYHLLEGSDRCERCGVDASTPDTQPLVRQHRRRRTVVITSHVARHDGWIELPSGTALAVDWRQNVQTLPI